MAENENKLQGFQDHSAGCDITTFNTRNVRGRRKLEHSGFEFTQIGWCENHQAAVWPLEEFFVRHPELTEGQKRHLNRNNPHGKCETMLPRGYKERGQE